MVSWFSIDRKLRNDRLPYELLWVLAAMHESYFMMILAAMARCSGDELRYHCARHLVAMMKIDQCEDPSSYDIIHGAMVERKM